MPAWIPAAIGAAGSIFSGIFGNSSQASANDRNFNFQREMYDKQRTDALTDRDYQNQYNAPTATMARLKDAGLNPNLIYNNGSATATAAPVRSSSPGNATAQPMKYDQIAGGITNALMMMYEIQATQAKTDNLKAQTDLAKANVIYRGNQSANSAFDLGFKNDSQNFMLEALQMKNRIYDKQAYKLDSDRDLSNARIKKTQADTTFTLNQDQRNALLTANTLRKGVEEVIRLKAQNANNGYERMFLINKLQNVKSDIDLKMQEHKLRKIGLTNSDPALLRLWNKALETYLEK
ncbi:DNA pilot protein [Blackfly microvirus SF02]|uniref:DNA pilot protein n=1 Tax=Blackfly microvirus SF02 TaxID=2576452 RepID=A0A4P8PJK5_9VIRU|nr:DNA pilot protein [Blackfly microvirus SF02]